MLYIEALCAFRTILSVFIYTKMIINLTIVNELSITQAYIFFLFSLLKQRNSKHYGVDSNELLLYIDPYLYLIKGDIL